MSVSSELCDLQLGSQDGSRKVKKLSRPGAFYFPQFASVCQRCVVRGEILLSSQTTRYYSRKTYTDISQMDSVLTARAVSFSQPNRHLTILLSTSPRITPKTALRAAAVNTIKRRFTPIVGSKHASAPILSAKLVESRTAKQTTEKRDWLDRQRLPVKRE